MQKIFNYKRPANLEYNHIEDSLMNWEEKTDTTESSTMLIGQLYFISMAK